MTRRNKIFIAGFIVVGVMIVAALVWGSLTLRGGRAELKRAHADRCAQEASTRLIKPGPRIDGFLFENVTFRRSVEQRGRSKHTRTTNIVWEQHCVVRCLRALVDEGFGFVEFREPLGDERSGTFRYTLEKSGHRHCLKLDRSQLTTDAAKRAHRQLKQGGKRCLARERIARPTASFALRRTYTVEKIGVAGMLLRFRTVAMNRATGETYAEQVYFAGIEFLKTELYPWPCRSPGLGKVQRLLRASDVFTPAKGAATR